MKPNKYLVYSARNFWLWFWRRLMDGFAPSDPDGNYQRPNGLNFNKNLKLELKDKKSLFLLVGNTCPWCHRTIITTELKQLSQINKIYLKPNIENGEWMFDKFFFGFKTVTDLYKKLVQDKYLRATLPLLISVSQNNIEIISNESCEIIEILNQLNDEGENIIRLENCEKDFLNKIHYQINNGVYKCGFARNQESYVKASHELFKSLNEINLYMNDSEGPWIFGNNLTYADIYLFPTMIRWELIYSKLFKCTEKDIIEYKNILDWRRKFYKLQGIDKTCFEKDWLKDYYQALFPLNPNQIVPLQPKLKEILKRY